MIRKPLDRLVTLVIAQWLYQLVIAQWLCQR